MILYILEGCGVFSEECHALPVTLTVLPSPKTVMLDGLPVRLAGRRVEIPATLKVGMHTLTVDGRAVSFRVKEGKLCTVQPDWRCLLPTLARVSYLETRVAGLEQAAKENEVDWLK